MRTVKCIAFQSILHLIACANAVSYGRNYGRTTDATWTILTMSVLCFCALIVVVPLLSMEGQKALGFHQKYLNLCSEDERRCAWYIIKERQLQDHTDYDITLINIVIYFTFKFKHIIQLCI